MPTKDNGNLKRGPMRPQPHGGALASPPPGGRPDNLQKARENRAATSERVAKDGDAALEEIHKDLTLLAKRIIKRAERDGKVPPKTTMEVIKEFRQTQEAVNEARHARGAVAEAEEFLASLDARVAEATARMEAGPKPAASLPA